jgi:hypothetical protein
VRGEKGKKEKKKKNGWVEKTKKERYRRGIKQKRSVT